MTRASGLLPLSLLFFGCRSTSSADAVALAPADVATTSPGPAVVAAAHVGVTPGGVGMGTPLTPQSGHELAAFAAGCFWGVEDAFRKVPGVTATAVGYTGGHTPQPTYERVCDHDTGHAETVLVELDPKRVSYAQLVRVFFNIHDPTTVNRQGPDVGDQYRSEIFTFSDEQARVARAVLADIQRTQTSSIVTKIEPVAAFWKAEAYHQQYAERTGFHGCPTRKVTEVL